MATKLKTEDHRIIEALRRGGVLRRVYGPKLVPRSENLILISCADGHQLPDIIEHLGNFVFCRHTLTVHGGALRLSRNFPENGNAGYPVGEFLLHQIEEARVLKKTNVLGLLSHYPCAIAMRHGLDISTVLTMTIDAKVRVQEGVPGMKIVPLFHYCDGDCRRTMFISAKQLGRR